MSLNITSFHLGIIHIRLCYINIDVACKGDIKITASVDQDQIILDDILSKTNDIYTSIQEDRNSLIRLANIFKTYIPSNKGNIYVF